MGVQLPGINPVTLEDPDNRRVRRTVSSRILIQPEVMGDMETGRIAPGLEIKGLVPGIRVFRSPVQAVRGRMIEDIDLQCLIACSTADDKRLFPAGPSPWIPIQAPRIGSDGQFILVTLRKDTADPGELDGLDAQALYSIHFQIPLRKGRTVFLEPDPRPKFGTY